MKKTSRLVSAVLAGVMVVSAVPAVSASAAEVKDKSSPKVSVSNIAKGIEISWKKTKGADKYVVLRKLATDKKFTTLKTVNKSKNLFVDKTVKAGKKYKYKIKTITGQAKTTSKALAIVRLTAPTVKAGTEKKDTFYIEWNQVAGAKRYEICHAVVKDGKIGKYKYLNTKKGTSQSEWDYSNRTVYYKVRAVCGKSKGVFSKPIKVDVFDAPYAFAGVNPDFSGIEINWSTDYGHKTFDGFRIYRSTEEGVKGKLIADLKKNKCIDKQTSILDDGYKYYSYKYLDTGLKDGTRYYYTLEAYDGKRTSRSTCVKAKYRSAAYTLMTGEVNKKLAKEHKESKELYELLGYEVTYSSEDESIFTLDKNYNIKGVSAGTANLVCTMVMLEGKVSSTTIVKVPVRVLPAKK